MNAQIRRAVRYNRTRHAPKDIQLFQCLMGMEPSGRPGSAFAAKVLEIQKSHNACLIGEEDRVDEDGKVGPQMEALFKDVLKSLDFRSIKLGVWLDQSPSWCVKNAEKLAAEYRRMGIDFVQIMVNPSGEKVFRLT